NLTSVRDAMITTTNQSSTMPVGLHLLNRWRTPAEIFSKLQKQNRDTALMGTTNFSQMLSEVAQPIGDRSKKARKDLIRIMERNRDYIDPVTGDRGRYYDNVGDLEQAYKETFNRLPTEAE